MSGRIGEKEFSYSQKATFLLENKSKMGVESKRQLSSPILF